MSKPYKKGPQALRTTIYLSREHAELLAQVQAELRRYGLIVGPSHVFARLLDEGGRDAIFAHPFKPELDHVRVAVAELRRELARATPKGRVSARSVTKVQRLTAGLFAITKRVATSIQEARRGREPYPEDWVECEKTEVLLDELMNDCAHALAAQKK